MFVLCLFEEWMEKKKEPAAIDARALRKDIFVRAAQSLQLDYISCIIKSRGQKY